MGFPERCKNHQNHNEKQGVCASCLRERLSLLSSASYNEVNSILFASSSPSPYFSPADDSSLPTSTTASSAVSQHRKRDGFGGTGIKGLFPSSSLSTTSSSSIMVKLGSIKGLKKSRSVVLVTRNAEEEDALNEKNKRKGFWSKLLSFKGKKNPLTHSRSMRLMIGRVNQIF
ncbi:hypothetical protein F3Y22_tig00112530pilonHSYRG00182 [Hibiscus syriacus]|uniref:Uncharacterized protein n=1 Tax=Hibiscus syriacus TaxID=106335 RepID=A0A6A2X948_HIBSY|nr:uncharacterized protein LOC120181759 [Hibiscus syriacus]KAE8665720.1 hypothetical protein F3Y22_tig00112530pilonHSYRG00182 [Hibiscus syriacus]